MPPLTPDLRTQLERAVRNARRAAEPGARNALQALGVHLPKAPDWMSGDNEKLTLRRRLRAHGRQVGDRLTGNGKAQDIAHLVQEVAYQHWHRMLFARFLAENHLLIEPDSKVAISLEECEDLARGQGVDPWGLAAYFAQDMLPAVFRRNDPTLDVVLAPETRQALQSELAALPVDVFTSDDGLGWTYQFWQADRKEEVNKSGVKIGAEELPAVTQLFTEHYMVLFLLHNTIGAWRAAKVLMELPDLATTAVDESELRRAVQVTTAGDYHFDYLRFVRERREGDDEGQPRGPWRPAAGRFDGWPTRAAELRVMDPCCGSGHFLVEAFNVLVHLRTREEGVPLVDAIRAVLADNIFGLEIDPRCAQIAAFNLAMAAWKLAGKPVELPALHIACSGLAPNASKEDWLSLADEAAAASGVPARANLLGRDESLWSVRVSQGLSALYDLFVKAPTLGSLIDPTAIGRDLYQADLEELTPLLAPVLARERASDEQLERAVAARGMAHAATLLGGQYTLVVTNVPYLGRGKQDDELKQHLEDHFPAGKGDLATAFVQRCLRLCATDGTAALVTPQKWLFLTRHRKLREDLLRSKQWIVVARLGPGAFETISGEVVNVTLLVLSNKTPHDRATLAGIDVSAPRGYRPIRANEKAAMLQSTGIADLLQREQAANPDCCVSLEPLPRGRLLEEQAVCRLGVVSGDGPQWIRKFWEVEGDASWRRLQSVPDGREIYSGRQEVIDWSMTGDGMLRPGADNPLFGRRGVAVGQMSSLPAGVYDGDLYDNNVAAIVPTDERAIPALLAFCRSSEFASTVRQLDGKIGVIHGSLLKVVFDAERWATVAMQEFHAQIPEPESADPTQWIFHGRPDATSESFHVAVARLLGYRWPAELDSEMRLSDRARDLVRKCDELLPFADRDGIVCLPSVRGEKPAADRLLSLLTACGIRPDRDLDEWLRTSFFEEHCKLFDHRPFVWHVWDGLEDGFNALVNYHRLAAPKGVGRKTLEALTYSYLGDWIERQRAAQRESEPGADARLAAALDLQGQLGRILSGEPPCDIFVRWKPLHEQPIGWDPDINDGVRLNIRPFLSVELRKGGRKGAGILRWKPNITWKKDRGTEPVSLRPRDAYPWFWGCSGDGTVQARTDFRGNAIFDGRRWNDLHYTNAVKREAREKAQAQQQAASEVTS